MAHDIQPEQHFHDPAGVTNPEHAEHHIVTPRQYVYVYLALLTGTLLTVLAADQNFGILNPVIALAIASTKMVIVILFFMHVKYQSGLIKMTVGAGFFTFLVLVTMTLCDYISRAWGLW
jgi:cytochrome c oxidase subunit 4